MPEICKVTLYCCICNNTLISKEYNIRDKTEINESYYVSLTSKQIASSQCSVCKNKVTNYTSKIEMF